MEGIPSGLCGDGSLTCGPEGADTGWRPFLPGSWDPDFRKAGLTRPSLLLGRQSSEG